MQDPAPSLALLLPLRVVAGAEGIVWVHVPFSFTDLSQIEKHLGSFSSDPDNYLKAFKYLTPSYCCSHVFPEQNSEGQCR